jgi:hypothetical protein
MFRIDDGESERASEGGERVKEESATVYGHDDGSLGDI